MARLRTSISSSDSCAAFSRARRIRSPSRWMILPSCAIAVKLLSDTAADALTLLERSFSRRSIRGRINARSSVSHSPLAPSSRTLSSSSPRHASNTDVKSNSMLSSASSTSLWTTSRLRSADNICHPASNSSVPSAVMPENRRISEYFAGLPGLARSVSRSRIVIV